jgi:2-keto-4-pentenoate hydratase
MNEPDISAAAAVLWRNWTESTRIDALPPACRPRDRAEAYAIQAALARLSGQRVAGWKIAATSQAGQTHIGVDGPFAGRLLADRVLEDGASISLSGILMRVVEAEFAFRFGMPLPKRATSYSVEEVLNAVDSLHPAIEIPDSRYHDFARVGAPQLIADNACACWFVLGPASGKDWRERDLVNQTVVAYRNGTPEATGTGAKVLGDPKVALTWVVNELSTFGNGLAAGEIVTTGTCIAPMPIAAGDRVRMDFGACGAVEAAFR